jgi:hypothetical protein
MSIFATNEKLEFLATQSLHYDRYAECQYFLERVEVNGKYGLACGEHSDEGGTHTRVLLPAVYDKIEVSKISSKKAIYQKYVVLANGTKVAQFTLVLNSWVPISCFDKGNIPPCVNHN